MQSDAPYRRKELFIDFVVLTIASLIIAVAVYFFLIPSHCAVASVTGLAIVLANFIPHSVALITLVINVVLLIIGFLTVDKEFGAKTVYTSIMIPVFIGMFQKMFPNFTSFTDSQTLDVLCHGFVGCLGLAMLFDRNASSGGLDIVAKILNKYMHIDFGKALSYVGYIVAFSSIFAYGSKTVILSILGTYQVGIVLDQFIFGRNLKRRVCIITKKEDELRQFVLHELKSGATIYKAIGAYRMQEVNEICVNVTRSEYAKLLTYLEQNDADAFVTVYNISHVRYKPKFK